MLIGWRGKLDKHFIDRVSFIKMLADNIDWENWYI